MSNMQQNMLSQREAQILELMAKGSTNNVIAAELGSAHRTVEQHITNIFNKLQVSDRTSAVLKGLGAGWICLQ
ncbi:MAG TPA: LuxR C-terminal-related transcriptional regulator [Roseiflexaceae bacterium]|nr:LuxR C-terminal-related transcriptional regulator [Roseiflexaceae bacterium]